MAANYEDAIAKAKDIEARIQELYRQQDELLEPLCVDAIASDDPNRILELAAALPRGFHRTELMTAHNGRLADPSYSGRVNTER